VTTQLTEIGTLFTWNSKDDKIRCQNDVEILIDNGRIIEIDTSTKKGDNVICCNHKLVTPGFVDSHTHPIFLQGREKEYAQRLAGESYQDIAIKGGGIQSSIDGVRNSTKNELIKEVLPRMDRFLQSGTTTIEAKSGYGLTTKSELLSLDVINSVSKLHEIDIVPTFMGAHAFPPEFQDDHEGYVDVVCKEMIPAVSEQGIAKYCDVFCEKDYFNQNQTIKILRTAKDNGLKLRLHADEFQDSNAAEVAAGLKCASADHLMAISESGILALAEKNITGTLLPGTTFFLGSTSYAPARKMIEFGVPIALATDFNPGSSHLQSMPFILNLACLFLHMSIEESIIASTWQGAVSLNCHQDVGSIELEKKADLIVWDVENPIEIVYNCPGAKINHVLKNGNKIF
jgi:imidazolonepropionase